MNSHGPGVIVIDWRDGIKEQREHYRLTSGPCGQMPVQAEGRTTANLPFFFHARGGGWTVRVSHPNQPTSFDLSAPDTVYVADGDDPTMGCMERQDVLAVLDEVLAPARLATALSGTPLARHLP